jgi:large subunit ribosomal protein L29
MAKKTTNVENINALSAEEISSRITEATLQYNKLRYSHAVTPLENPLSIRAERKNLAKLKTAQRRQQLGF